MGDGRQRHRDDSSQPDDLEHQNRKMARVEILGMKREHAALKTTNDSLQGSKQEVKEFKKNKKVK